MKLQCAIANAYLIRATRFIVPLKDIEVSVLMSIRLCQHLLLLATFLFIFHRDIMSINLLLFVRNSCRMVINTSEKALEK